MAHTTTKLASQGYVDDFFIPIAGTGNDPEQIGGKITGTLEIDTTALAATPVLKGDVGDGAITIDDVNTDIAGLVIHINQTQDSQSAGSSSSISMEYGAVEVEAEDSLRVKGNAVRIETNDHATNSVKIIGGSVAIGYDDSSGDRSIDTRMEAQRSSVIHAVGYADPSTPTNPPKSYVDISAGTTYTHTIQSSGNAAVNISAGDANPASIYIEVDEPNSTGSISIEAPSDISAVCSNGGINATAQSIEAVATAGYVDIIADNGGSINLTVKNPDPTITDPTLNLKLSADKAFLGTAVYSGSVIGHGSVELFACGNTPSVIPMLVHATDENADTQNPLSALLIKSDSGNGSFVAIKDLQDPVDDYDAVNLKTMTETGDANIARAVLLDPNTPAPTTPVETQTVKSNICFDYDSTNARPWQLLANDGSVDVPLIGYHDYHGWNAVEVGDEEHPLTLNSVIDPSIQGSVDLDGRPLMNWKDAQGAQQSDAVALLNKDTRFLLNTPATYTLASVFASASGTVFFSPAGTTLTVSPDNEAQLNALFALIPDPSIGTKYIKWSSVEGNIELKASKTITGGTVISRFSIICEGAETEIGYSDGRWSWGTVRINTTQDAWVVHTSSAWVVHTSSAWTLSGVAVASSTLEALDIWGTCSASYTSSQPASIGIKQVYDKGVAESNTINNRINDVSTDVSGKVSKSGDTMSGDLSINGTCHVNTGYTLEVGDDGGGTGSGNISISETGINMKGTDIENLRVDDTVPPSVVLPGFPFMSPPNGRLMLGGKLASLSFTVQAASGNTIPGSSSINIGNIPGEYVPITDVYAASGVPGLMIVLSGVDINLQNCTSNDITLNNETIVFGQTYITGN